MKQKSKQFFQNSLVFSGWMSIQWLQVQPHIKGWYSRLLWKLWYQDRGLQWGDKDPHMGINWGKVSFFFLAEAKELKFESIRAKRYNIIILDFEAESFVNMRGFQNYISFIKVGSKAYYRWLTAIKEFCTNSRNCRSRHWAEHFALLRAGAFGPCQIQWSNNAWEVFAVRNNPWSNQFSLSKVSQLR